MGQFGVGQAVRRKEDVRLLTGEGNFVDDMTLDNQAYAYVLRSPHAHAKLNAIDTAAALKEDGVIAILTAADLTADDIGPVPCLAPATSKDGTVMFVPTRSLLATDRVRHVGDPVALVIGESLIQARDAGRIDRRRL